MKKIWSRIDLFTLVVSNTRGPNLSLQVINIMSQPILDIIATKIVRIYNVYCIGHEITNNLHITKTQISFAVTAKLISAFVFVTRIVQFLFYLHPKFQASSSFL